MNILHVLGVSDNGNKCTIADNFSIFPSIFKKKLNFY